MCAVLEARAIVTGAGAGAGAEAGTGAEASVSPPMSRNETQGC